VKGVNSDLYQLLSYLTATDLSSGLLIYAKGEAEPITHRVVYSDKVLEIRTLDFACSPDELLDQISALAARIRQMRREGAMGEVA
jgi:5-methylcytosine-specific restriction enzyme subunit McrC